MYHGVPDQLSRVEAAQVDAEMSVDPELFQLLDRDQEWEFELSDKDVPAMMDMISAYDWYADAHSMGWVARHDQPHRAPLDLGFEDNATGDKLLPAIDLGFEHNAAGDKPLPAIDLGFHQNAASDKSLPAIDLGFHQNAAGDNPFPAMGFEDYATGNKPVPAIDLGFDQSAASDKSLQAIDLGFRQNAAGDIDL
ncbi:hypothetical protein M405DRAFT_839179 [Rhizopogon salebrosus TDB-379]|nr:hypothetical protein M405DRAFT_839179 [Rhizopogon salebrosus TDB-379]